MRSPFLLFYIAVSVLSVSVMCLVSLLSATLLVVSSVLQLLGLMSCLISGSLTSDVVRLRVLLEWLRPARTVTSEMFRCVVLQVVVLFRESVCVLGATGNGGLRNVGRRASRMPVLRSVVVWIPAGAGLRVYVT